MKKLYAIAAILLCLLSSKPLFASHASGMDISYTCLGNNQYQFVVTFYRDCFGIQAPSSMVLQISSASCGFSTSASAFLVYTTQGTDSIAHLAGLCPGLNSQCVGGSYQGYEQYIYATTVTFNQECSDWVIGVAESARNAAITNLQNASSYDLYVECHLDNTDSLCNNSPIFTNIPLAYSCTNQIFLYNHGAIDPDGDSLSYQLVNPLGGPGNPIPYSSGSFSPTYPLSTSTGTFGFDPETGQMTCVPNQNQIAVISVVITEWRDQQIIGTTQRDLQVVISTCSNIVPEIPAGIENVVGGVPVDSTTVNVCPGSTITFDLVGVDQDAGNNLDMTTNLSQTIPTATFSTSGSNPITGTFSWVTQPSDSGIYTFTVTIGDDACPISGQQIYSFTINVTNTPVNAGPDTSICAALPVIQLNAQGNPPFSWSSPNYLDDPNIANPIATFPGAGSYQLIVTGGVGTLCEKKDTIVITVTPDLSVSVGAAPDTVCAGSLVNLSSSASGGTGTYTYNWSSSPAGFNSNLANTTTNPDTTTQYIMTVNSGACVKSVDVEVFVHQLPSSDFVVVPTEVCEGAPVLINYTGTPAPGYHYLWDFYGGVIFSGSGPGPYTVYWGTGGIKTITLTVTDTFGCTSTQSQQMTVNPKPVVTFNAVAGGCVPLTVEFENTTPDGATFLWNFGDGATSTDENPTHTYTSSGTFDVTLTVVTTQGCSGTLSLPDYITVTPVPIADATVQENITIPVDVTQATFHFNNLSQNATSYLWDFGDGTTSSDLDPEHTYNSADTFFVVLTAFNEFCSDTFTIGPIIVVNYNDIFFPTGFSPNGDGKNDYFHELSQKGIISLYYAVYNRWGEMIFETDQIDGMWNGEYKSEPAEVGVYVWYAKAHMLNGNDLSKKGDVTLLR